MDLGSGQDELQDDPFGVAGICGTEDTDSVGFESGRGSCNTGIVRRDRELTVERRLEVWLILGVQGVLSQLANAGGELRMTELAGRALISRSGMTRVSPGLSTKGSSAVRTSMGTLAASSSH